MRDVVTIVVAVASGCGFAAPNQAAIGPDASEATADAPPTVARTCIPGDATLRLCVDFEDATRLAYDGSSYGHTVTRQDALSAMARDAEQAVQLTPQSRLVIAESPQLDIPQHLTTMLWFEPQGVTTDRWLLDNNEQYFIAHEAGFVRCGIGDRSVAALAPLTEDWHHVACGFDGEMLKVYIDGSVARCEPLVRQVPTSGTVGLAIGSNLGRSGTGLAFTDVFSGGIDNVQVFARTLTDAEVCGAAGRVSCTTACPAP